MTPFGGPHHFAHWFLFDSPAEEAEAPDAWGEDDAAQDALAPPAAVSERRHRRGRTRRSRRR